MRVRYAGRGTYISNDNGAGSENHAMSHNAAVYLSLAYHLVQPCQQRILVQ